MFARQTLRSARLAQPVARRNASDIAAKVNALTEKTVYCSKVAIELSKAVYKKEGLAPPSVAEFTKVYECAVNQAKLFAKDPKAASEAVVKNAQGFSKDETLRYICYFIQIVGFFSLGEIIGRRNIVGYEQH